MYKQLTLLNNLVDFFLPKQCVGCGTVGMNICDKCKHKKLQKREVHICHVCKSETFLNLIHTECKNETYLDGVIACYFYNNFARDLVKQMKYSFKFSLAEDIARLMYEGLKTYSIDFDAITSVPLSRWKKKFRGFNQAELIARNLSSLLNVDYIETLSREINTDTQVGKSRDLRQQNLQDAFQSIAFSQHVKNVLLVDDVMTTGTTLELCAKEIKYNGETNVFGIVLSRG